MKVWGFWECNLSLFSVSAVLSWPLQPVSTLLLLCFKLLQRSSASFFCPCSVSGLFSRRGEPRRALDMLLFPATGRFCQWMLRAQLIWEGRHSCFWIVLQGHCEVCCHKLVQTNRKCFSGCSRSHGSLKGNIRGSKQSIRWRTDGQKAALHELNNSGDSIRQTSSFYSLTAVWQQQKVYMKYLVSLW